jgi:2-dehydro-3-deoxyglucarate aldolase/4-hydroxy-2-oxoheptanedioate aldolase
MRPLEAGSSGIMASMVRSAAETRSIVNWAKFYPQGGRGVNGTGVDGGYGQYPGAEYFKRANERTFVAIQIEHADAVADVDAIAAVPDVDLLFIGPADLSQSMGLPGQWSHPDVLKAIEKVAKACAANGVAWGILPRDEAHANQCRDLGCRLFSIGIDVWFFQRGVRSYIEQWPSYFPKS